MDPPASHALVGRRQKDTIRGSTAVLSNKCGAWRASAHGRSALIQAPMYGVHAAVPSTDTGVERAR
eukprot:13468153-Alexandrium_andersonii.AAC.1